jgi:hypothetical protein
MMWLGGFIAVCVPLLPVGALLQYAARTHRRRY